jgi:preprotein translocase subunit SecG
MNPVYLVCLIAVVIVAIFLILLIILHAPKAEGMGGIGGSAVMFSGKRDADAGLDRVTWIVTTVFMLLCLVLGFGFVRP